MSRCGKAVWWLAVFAAGCSDDPAPDECGLHPDFFLTVRAEDSTLPRDLSLLVEYGGGTDMFALSRTTQTQIVFCEPIPAELGGGGSGGSGGEGGEGGHETTGYGALECELWTEGPATVQITGSGFQLLERELRVDADECVTAVELELPVKPAPM